MESTVGVIKVTEETFQKWKELKGIRRVNESTGWYFDKYGNGIADTDRGLFSVFKMEVDQCNGVRNFIN